MDDTAFDHTLVGVALDMAARVGWGHVTVAEAARRAGLPLARARARFPNRSHILWRFGLAADEAALSSVSGDSPRDRLFDLLMRRIDAFQAHREGVIAVFRSLPLHPESAAAVALGTWRSMRWMLSAAGIPAHGMRGVALAKGLVGVWMYALRAWQKDHSTDLSATMAALDRAMGMAERVGGWVGGAAPQQDEDYHSSAGDPATVPHPHPPWPEPESASEADPATLPESQQTGDDVRSS